MSHMKKSFRKASYRGVELSEVLEKTPEEIVKMLPSRQRRRYSRGVQKKYETLVKKLIYAKNHCEEGEKPTGVKTHLRNCIILPDMVGSVCEVYTGRVFQPVEIRADMIGHYLAEFAMSYKPVAHGKLGVGATRSSKFTATT
jgi:small subunit ribosomal protein S15e